MLPKAAQGFTIEALSAVVVATMNSFLPYLGVFLGIAMAFAVLRLVLAVLFRVAGWGSPLSSRGGSFLSDRAAGNHAGAAGFTVVQYGLTGSRGRTPAISIVANPGHVDDRTKGQKRRAKWDGEDAAKLVESQMRVDMREAGVIGAPVGRGRVKFRRGR